jgi:predicted AAA+ superfamily ATPase
MYSRYLNLNLPQGQSAFLWGARKTGKSTYLKMMYPDSVRFDLLNSSLELKFTKAPWQFREEVLSLPKEKLLHPIIVDEIQKVPAIMDEIHWLIENSEAYFICL